MTGGLKTAIDEARPSGRAFWRSAAAFREY
jgi:hypothetical protein